MPLKKPKNIPEVPKARAKNIEAIKEHIPQKKETEIEFVCKVYFQHNPQKKVQEYCIALETVKLFSSLNYEITIQSEKKKNEIDISILGLKTKQKYMSEVSPADAEVFFQDLYGKQTINIIKQDGSINSAIFDFNVFKKKIILIEEFLPEKKNNRKFCTFEVAEDKFTFSREGLL